MTVSTDHPGAGSASRSTEDTDTKAQLARLEDGLVADFGGSTDANAVLREHVDRSLCGFSAARIQRYLPILIERAVRRRLHGS